MTTIIILTGPQGAGNHLFSKIFSANEHIKGWNANSEYWVPHSEEIFNECWLNPELLKTFDFSGSQYWFTSISCPFMKNGEFKVPDYEKFFEICKKLGIILKLVIIGRDQSILKHQQIRVRDAFSLPIFLHYLPELLKISPLFVSSELLYLYKQHYVKNIFQQLSIPGEIDLNLLEKILVKDTNEKYITNIEIQQFDLIVKQVSGLS